MLIWNSIPTTNQRPADVVLGQPNFNSNTANNGGLGAGSLYYPIGVSSDGTRLFVADYQNYRVLIWNSIPTTNQKPADVVLGQPDFTSNTGNNGGLGAGSLGHPIDVSSDGTRLFVADEDNHRVLIWNSIPTTSQKLADVVLGQASFTSNTANNGGLGAGSLNLPRGVSSDGRRLFVADSSNFRILIWNSIPTTNQKPADVVLGQPSFTSNSVNNGGLGAGSLNLPGGVSSDGTRLFVADYSNSRILIFDEPQFAACLTFSRTPAFFRVEPLTVTATFSDALQTPPTLAIAGGAAGASPNDVARTAMSSTGDPTVFTFSHSIQAGDDGLFTVTLDATSTSGTPLTTQPSDNMFTIDTTPPTVALTYGNNAAAVGAGPLTLTATFSEALAATPTLAIDAPGTANDLAATPLSATSNPAIWTHTATITPGTGIDGPATVTIAGGQDAAGNLNLPAANSMFTIDAAPPTVALTYTKSALAVGPGPLTITATFSEAIATTPTLAIDAPGTANDLTATALSATSDARVWSTTATIAPGTGRDGPATVTIAGGKDAAGNDNQPATNPTFTVDVTGPTASLSYVPSASLSQAGQLTIRIDFSESIRSVGPTPAILFDRTAGTGQLSGGSVTVLSNTLSTYTTSVAATNNGTFTIRLDAADAAGNQVVQPATNNTLTIAVPNARPVADAGADRTFDVGTLVGLNGSNSFDPDGDAIAYAWTVEAQPEGASVSLSSATTPQPTFTPLLAGTYRFGLEVSDPLGARSTDSVSITAQPATGGNRNPVANAGQDRTVILGGIVRLDAGASSDADGDHLSYLWSFIEVPTDSLLTNADLSDVNSSTVSFEPDVIGRYRLAVTAGDGHGGSDTDSVLVTVLRQPPDDYADSFDQATFEVATGTEVLGTLGSSTDTDFMLFPVATGNIYTVSLASTNLSSFQLALFSPEQKILMRGNGTPIAGVTLRDYRPITGLDHFLRVTSPDRSTGKWQLTVSVRPETEVLPPPLTLETVVSGGQALSAVRTRGTSVPLSALQLVVAYDGSSLDFRNTTIGPAASESFAESPRQFFFPFVDLTFQTKQAVAATVPPGHLDTLNFEAREAGNLYLDSGSVTILQVSVTRPQRQVAVLRPSADAGLSRSLEPAPLPDGRPGFPDPVSPTGVRRPFVRLDGRFSLDANVPALPLKYAWSVLASPAATVRLSDASSPVPTLAFAGPGLYRFGLNVSNGVLASPTGTVSLVIDRARVAPSAEVTASSTSILFGDPQARGEEALVLPAGSTVRLDGRASTDPEPARRATLTYRWRQTSGPAVGALATEAVLNVRIPDAGAYAFELTVTNNLGIESSPARLGLLAFVAGLKAPGLTVVASTPATVDRGADLGPDPDTSGVAALRVPAGNSVTLSATVSRSPSELESKLGFFWQQTEGAAVRFSQSTAEVTTASVSRVDFTPREAGLYAFACTARVLDPLGNVTGLKTRRFIRIVADSSQRRVPAAAIRVTLPAPAAAKTDGPPQSLTAGASVFVNAGQLVRLDGTASLSASPGVTALRFFWRQPEGPPVVLSDPSSAVTTFVAPDLGDRSARSYAFQLFTDDGTLRSAPDLARLAVVPPATFAAELTVSPGLNLASVPIAALGAVGPMTLEDLARLAGASLVVAGGRDTERRGRFVLTVGFGALGEDRVAGNRGYLLKVEGQTPRTLQLVGGDWPPTSRDLELNAGLNLISYPARQVPDVVRTSAGLLRLAKNASFVARLTRAQNGQPRFEVYLSGLTPEFPLEPGRAYILSNRVAETVSLP